MPVPIFKPRSESDLLLWSANFAQIIGVDPMAFGLTAPQASQYQLLHDEYAAAYAATHNPGTNSQAMLIAKNQAKQQLLNGPGGAWELVRIVQAFPGATDSMRGDLGLRLTTARQRVGPPRTAPLLTILHTSNRNVKCRLRDVETPTRRGKPHGAIGATVLFHAGEHAPTHLSEWMFARNTSRAVFNVTIPSTVPPGQKVWLCAFWINARMQSGPPSACRSTYIADGLALAA